MKGLKYGVMLLTILFLSQLHVYAEENRWTWPVEGQISDYFGTRHGKHYGIDIAAPIGAAVAAIQDGKVTKSYYSSSYGNVVFITTRIPGNCSVIHTEGSGNIKMRGLSNNQCRSRFKG